MEDNLMFARNLQVRKLYNKAKDYVEWFKQVEIECNGDILSENGALSQIFKHTNVSDKVMLARVYYYELIDEMRTAKTKEYLSELEIHNIVIDSYKFFTQK